MTILRTTPKISSITLTGLEVVNLPFGSGSGVSEDGPYLVKQIDGLDPPDQIIAIAKTASGGKYQGKESEDREIVMLIELHGDPEALRNHLYTMLNTGYDPRVRINLNSGGLQVAYVWGYVSRFESALWVEQPVVQITFTCLNTVFKAPIPTSYLPANLSEKNPSIYNEGTAESGFQFAVKFTDDMDHWFLRVAEDNSIGMTFDKNFNVGDVLEVSTIPGQRYVHWKKAGGTVQNKMSILREDSEWIALHPGHNHFAVPAGTTKWQWKGNLTFTKQYWGV